MTGPAPFRARYRGLRPTPPRIDCARPVGAVPVEGLARLKPAVKPDLVGFTGPPQPATYWTSLLYAFRSTISLTDNQVTLTAWGQLLQALLRLTGPVLLGLALLALRNRVKR